MSVISYEGLDIDWFATDSQGYVLHLASGGGVLPESVAYSKDDLEQLYAYFSAQHISNKIIHISPDVAQGKSVSELNRYTESFISYAQRGLFSFDKTELSNPQWNNFYHLVASPLNPLSVTDLPITIAAIVSRTRLPFAVAGAFSIDTSIVGSSI